MAWNEPGGSNSGNNQHDPWNEGGRRRTGGDGSSNFRNPLKGMFGGGPADNTWNLLGTILGALLSVWFLMGCYQLDEQERAVVLHFGAYSEMVGPGFHWNPPLIDSVYRENVTKVRTHSSRGNMLTDDVNIVEVTLSVQYNIADLKKFTLSIRDPELTLEEATDSALRHVIGSSTMDDVLTTGREKIAVQVKDRLRQYLEAYNTGIDVITVNVEKTQAPTDVQAAFDDVIKAREDEQRVQNEAQAYANQIVPESRGKASRILQDAQAYRDATVAKAEGEAARFKKLLVEYKKAPTVTRQRLYIDTVQQVMQNSSKVMINSKNGNNMMYLPLDKLTQGQPPTEGAATPNQETMSSLQQQIDALKVDAARNTRRREVRP